MAAAPPTARRQTPPGKAIGFDIGGTKIACGVVTTDGEPVEAPLAFPTPNGREGLLEVMNSAVQELRSRHSDIAVIGVGAAGLVEWPTGRIVWAPNNGYRDLPLRQLLEGVCGIPTVVDNDANVAAWAEARRNGAPGYMLFLTVGTGVGGGLVLDGELYRGSSGMGGEIGHLAVDPHGGVRCGCGNLGCLEAVASGSALGRYGREAAMADLTGTLAELAGSPGEVSGETVTEAALAGDSIAQALVGRVGEWLGIAIASLVNVLDLQRVAVGGGVATAGELLLGPARGSLRRYLFAREHRVVPEIMLASEGANAGWIGAGLLGLDLRPTDAAVPPATTPVRPTHASRSPA